MNGFRVLRRWLVPITRRNAQRQFVRDTLVLQSGQFASIFISGVISIVTTRILGPTLLGLYTLSLTMSAVMALFDLSASGRVALVEIARALGADNHDDVRDALAYLLRINLQINGLLALIFFLVAPPLAETFYQNINIGLWARWLGLMELTDLPYQILSIVYQSQRQMKRLVRLETTRLIVSSVAMIGVLMLQWGVPGLIFSQLAVSMVYAVYSIFCYRQIAVVDTRFPGWTILLGRMSKVGVRSRLSLGFRVAVDKNLGGFISQLPILLLGGANQAAVGYFGTALKIVSLPQPLVSGIARNLETFLPFRAAQGQASLRSAFARSTLYTGLLWSAATVGYAIVAAPLLIVLYGWDFTPSIPMLFPLLLQSLAVGLGVSLGSTFRTLNKLGYSIALQIAPLVIIGPIGYWLIQNQGGYGAAWFYGARILVQTGMAILVVLWLLKRAEASGSAANSKG